MQIRIPVRKIAFFTDLVWQLGGEARIVELVEAIDYMKQKIDTVRQRYL